MAKKILILILGLGLLVRLAGVNFGLPLWLVADEASSIFGALKMLELRTLLPALHQADFGSILYYPPYISYLYLPVFVGIIGLKWLSFSGALTDFAWILKSDVSVFFLLARVYSVVFSTITIYLVYRAALNIFKKQNLALWSAMAMAFSFLPVSFGHWARHWTPVTAVFALLLYVLSHPIWPVSKRYKWIALIGGLGIGINLQVGFAMLFVVFWALAIDKLKFSFFKDKWFWHAMLIFGATVSVAYFIWPHGFAFLNHVSENTTDSGNGKNLAGIVQAYGFYLQSLGKADPAILIAFLSGTILMWRKYRALVNSIWAFLLIYIAFFYWVFATNDRFILVMYPFFAVMAGFSLGSLQDWVDLKNKKLSKIVMTLVAALFIIPVLRLDFLLMKNDTRIQAANFVSENLSTAKIAVLVPLMRLPSTAESVQELAKIDPLALRTIDQAEAKLTDQSKKLNVLNLYTVNNSDFLADFKANLQKQGVEYLVINEEFARLQGVKEPMSSLGETINYFPGTVSLVTEDSQTGHQRIPDGYGDGLRELFFSPSLGPNILVIKLSKS